MESKFKTRRMKRQLNHDTGTYKPQLGLTIYVILFYIIVYLPIISVVVFSFNASNSATNWGGFSLRWYEELFTNDTLLDCLWINVSVAFIATIISTLIGTAGALGLAELGKQKRTHFVNFALSVNNLPVVNPDIVTAVSLMALFFAIKNIMPMGYTTMVLAHIAFCTPYVVIQVYPKVLTQDPSEIEAAMDLGATRRQAVWKVVIPDLIPAILSGSMLAFTMSFDDFIISYFVGGSEQNISVYLYTLKKFKPVVNSLSTLIVFVIGLLVIAFQILSTRSGKKEERASGKKKEAVSNSEAGQSV